MNQTQDYTTNETAATASRPVVVSHVTVGNFLFIPTCVRSMIGALNVPCFVPRIDYNKSSAYSIQHTAYSIRHTAASLTWERI